MRGKIVEIRLFVLKQKLKVTAEVHTGEKGVFEAFLPDRELSAILPRSLFLLNKKSVPENIFETITPIVKRMTVGRMVRLWEYRGVHYFSFLSWRDVVITGSSGT